ncbi:hypothetical protein [Tardiphaga robiniae]|uniref:Uncharacterized protein n=2 Tax=Tardiphaga robiniae TaxID=943830 RepID=A0A164B0F5_9BRAD|nr:hypothetical protein [Tardiphaga robiniae]KZD25585.1 hypothetical protein A4A58_04045 [Tardiphaga robiniae]
MSAAAMKHVNAKFWIWMAVAAGLLLVLMANAHMVYVALWSQPDCIDHVKRGTSVAEAGKFSAASSSCTPRH